MHPEQIFYGMIQLYPYLLGEMRKRERSMQADKTDILKRMSYIEGHLNGVHKMIESDQYCVDILRQTYAVRKAIEKMEAIILEQHLHCCVPEGIKEGREEEVISELLQLYNIAGNR
jgi:CsoR family transcriptional regulator, copper-sensing transcriptional repressor